MARKNNDRTKCNLNVIYRMEEWYKLI